MERNKKELEVLNELNRGLMNNQSVYKDKLATLEATHKEKDSTIAVCYHTLHMHAATLILCRSVFVCMGCVGDGTHDVADCKALV